MNNKVIAVIIAIVIIAGAAFLLMRGNNDTDVASDIQSTESAAQVSAENASIKSLISSGRNQKCTFSSTEQGAETNGTVYVSSSKMRGDFATKSSSVNTASHMIHDGTTSYVWTDGQSTGFKMTLDAKESATSENQSIDPNKNFEFNCERWTVDNSKFELPSGVSFSELPIMPSMNTNVNSTTGTSGSLDTKAICNSLPEPAKTQCLAN